MRLPDLLEAVEAVDYALKNAPSQLPVDLTVAAKEAKRFEKPRLRLSFGKRCAREKWYAHHEPEQADPSDPKMEVRWIDGNVWEAVVYARLRAALPEPWSLGLEDWQRTVWLQMGSLEVRGHLDGILRYRSEPYAVIDPKETTKWAFKSKWQNGRLPDPMWGYLHQAGNYQAALKREGVQLQGHIWPVRTIEFGDTHVGWARPEELYPYFEEAREVYALALDDTPPPRCEGYPNDAPCRGRKVVYCDFYRRCSEDQR